MMICLLVFILVCVSPTYAQQYYDSSDCSSGTSQAGSKYICNSFQKSCPTFLVYRAKEKYQTISNISDLFQMNSDELLQWNKHESSSENLKTGREVLIPVTCYCSGQFFQASFSYVAPESTTLAEIACGVFEGLLKSFTVREENPSGGNEVKAGSKLHVPLRCACPDRLTSTNGVKYLVTYPIVEGDETRVLVKKFGISSEDLWAANSMEPMATVFPNTTVLVPLKKDSVINFNVPDSPPPAPGFLPAFTVEGTRRTKLKGLYIAGSVVGFSLVALLAYGLYRKDIGRRKGEKLPSFNARVSISSPRSVQTGRSSTNSCLSPDVLAGIKYSLINYSIESLKRATREFCEDTKIEDLVYLGIVDDVEVMIKQMKLEDTKRVIDVHSNINHVNIVKLHGVCCQESYLSWSYLVFELPSNGCLRECLSNPSCTLLWRRRVQIAFDIATALHYLHCCIFPAYTHASLHSRNVYITANWRAKLADIGDTRVAKSSKGNRWVAPEYLLHGSASEKVDVFAFGVVLLEIISGREDIDGSLFKDSIGVLLGGNEDSCFEQLRKFMDPSLKEDYPLAEALCLAVLAKACVEDDPLHRPSMDDIIKVIARIV